MLTTRLTLLLLPLAADGLTLVPAATTHRRAHLDRRSVLAGLPLALSTAAVAVEDDDDLNQDDEIPDVRSGRPSKGASKKADSTPADGAAAFKDIVAARKQLDRADNLIAGKDFKALSAMLSAAPVSTFETSALVLVQSKALKNPEDIKAIGTIKRYGVGADAIIMLGGLGQAASAADASGAESYLQKAKASLDEIIGIGKSNGLALS